jgi:hypothetical protein
MGQLCRSAFPFEESAGAKTFRNPYQQRDSHRNREAVHEKADFDPDPDSEADRTTRFMYH